MLGTRFDLAETVVELAQRTREALAIEAAEREAVLGDYCHELENQIAEVARRFHSAKRHTGFSCPIWDNGMHLHGKQHSAEFVVPGFEQHDLECDSCGLTTTRHFHAVHGYHDLAR